VLGPVVVAPTPPVLSASCSWMRRYIAAESKADAPPSRELNLAPQLLVGAETYSRQLLSVTRLRTRCPYWSNSLSEPVPL
jgi:hypothetical protein